MTCPPFLLFSHIWYLNKYCISKRQSLTSHIINFRCPMYYPIPLYIIYQTFGLHCLYWTRFLLLFIFWTIHKIIPLNSHTTKITFSPIWAHFHYYEHIFLFFKQFYGTLWYLWHVCEFCLYVPHILTIIWSPNDYPLYHNINFRCSVYYHSLCICSLYTKLSGFIVYSNVRILNTFWNPP